MSERVNSVLVFKDDPAVAEALIRAEATHAGTCFDARFPLL